MLKVRLRQAPRGFCLPCAGCLSTCLRSLLLVLIRCSPSCCEGCIVRLLPLPLLLLQLRLLL